MENVSEQVAEILLEVLLDASTGKAPNMDLGTVHLDLAEWADDILSSDVITMINKS
ncbi:MAG: hypothetical protein HOF71_05370 [Chloroflexi bacterium]|jgi:hypothetical protein|nr:hypothetical protein [Chloroflexota bacterium]